MADTVFTLGQSALGDLVQLGGTPQSFSPSLSETAKAVDSVSVSLARATSEVAKASDAATLNLSDPRATSEVALALESLAVGQVLTGTEVAKAADTLSILQVLSKLQSEVALAVDAAVVAVAAARSGSEIALALDSAVHLYVGLIAVSEIALASDSLNLGSIATVPFTLGTSQLGGVTALGGGKLDALGVSDIALASDSVGAQRQLVATDVAKGNDSLTAGKQVSLSASEIALGLDTFGHIRGVVDSAFAVDVLGSQIALLRVLSEVALAVDRWSGVGANLTPNTFGYSFFGTGVFGGSLGAFTIGQSQLGGLQELGGSPVDEFIAFTDTALAIDSAMQAIGTAYAFNEQALAVDGGTITGFVGLSDIAKGIDLALITGVQSSRFLEDIAFAEDFILGREEVNDIAIARDLAVVHLGTRSILVVDIARAIDTLGPGTSYHRSLVEIALALDSVRAKLKDRHAQRLIGRTLARLRGRIPKDQTPTVVYRPQDRIRLTENPDDDSHELADSANKRIRIRSDNG